MRNQQEVRELKEKLEKLTGFIGEFGTLKEFYNKDVQFSCNASDALSWILGEITIEQFISDASVNFTHLKEIALMIERRTGLAVLMLRCEDRVHGHKKTVHNDPNHRRLSRAPDFAVLRTAGGYCRGALAHLPRSVRCFFFEEDSVF